MRIKINKHIENFGSRTRQRRRGLPTAESELIYNISIKRKKIKSRRSLTMSVTLTTYEFVVPLGSLRLRGRLKVYRPHQHKYAGVLLVGSHKQRQKQRFANKVRFVKHHRQCGPGLRLSRGKTTMRSAGQETDHETDHVPTGCSGRERGLFSQKLLRQNRTPIYPLLIWQQRCFQF